MKDRIINVYKKTGETPLDCINNIKKVDQELRFVPMTYAGRLDPLAEGVLIVLTGDMCHKKDEYLSLTKEYELDVLFGFKTDTYDVMGKILEEDSSGKLFEKSSGAVEGSLSQTISNNLSSDFISKIQKVLPEFIGRIKQLYPPYSSRTVKGKPLFEWAREGKIDEIEIPSHDVYVENIEIIGQTTICGQILLGDIKEKISKVSGDFRQEEIHMDWQNSLQSKEQIEFLVVKLKIICGSGVYVRSIANELGKKLGIPALALKIVRTKVGEYGI